MKKTEKDLYLTHAEYLSIIEAAYAYRQDIGLLFDLLANGGLRISEALQIKVSDIDFSKNIISINTLKRREARKDDIKYNPATMQKLKAYIEDKKVTDKVFGFGRVRAFQLMKQVLKKIPEINQRYSLHAFRHYHALECLASVKDISLVALRLRHTSPKTTYRYVHLSEDIQDLILEGLTKRRD